jgi:hypothetical protein
LPQPERGLEMSKERKRGLPSDGELTDDKLEISGGAGGDVQPNVEPMADTCRPLFKAP